MLKSNLSLSSILAGMSIGFGAILNIIAKAYLPAIWGTVIGAILFSIGLTIVCWYGLLLFTGKVGVARHTTKASRRNLSKLHWLMIILFGNLVGASIMGLLVQSICLLVPESLFSMTVAAINTNIINSIIEGNIFFNIFSVAAKGFVCGVLVYLAVYFYNKNSNKALKVLSIILCVAAFILLGMPHCIANIFYLTAGGIYESGFAFLAIASCTVGNAIGGMAIDFAFNTTTIKKYLSYTVY